MIENGDRIGRIRVEDRLGQGGMGSVFKGYDEILGRPVALKVSVHEGNEQPLDKLRFLREARVLSKLDHPNICRIHDLIERPDADILVLEYIDGKTLKQLEAEGKLSHEDKLKIFEKLAEVLHRTHSVKVVHRDLKPDNIMISKEGKEIKVLDFGLARQLEEVEQPPVRRRSGSKKEPDLDPEKSYAMDNTNSLTLQQGGIFGTPRYMSPEQAGGRLMTPASDMFSLGLVMLRIFTGHTLYDEGIPLPALVFRVSQGQFKPIEELTSDLDSDLASLIHQLTSFEPADRPTAVETQQLLKTIRKKPLIQARKRRLMFATAFAAILFVAGFLGIRRLTHQPVLLEPGKDANVLILPFVNRTGDDRISWVEWGLRNVLAESLAIDPRIEFIQERHVRDLTTSGMSGARTLSQSQLESLSKSLGANFFVRTLVEKSRSGFALRSTLYDTYGPKRTVEVQAPALSAAARRLGRQLGEWLLPGTQASDDAFSEHDLVNQLYAMGLEKHLTAGPKVSIDFFKLCMSLDPTFFPARARYAHCLVLTGETEEAEALALAIMNSPKGKQDHRLRLQCYLTLSRVSFNGADWDRAENLLAEAIQLAEKHNERLKMAELYNQLSVAKIRKKELDEAQDILDKAVKIFDKEGNLHGKAKALSNMGVNGSDAGRYEEAETYYNQALQIARDTEDRPLTGLVLVNLGVLMWEVDDMNRAEEFYLQALKIYDGLGLREQTAILYNNLAGVAMSRGNNPKAAEYFENALTVFRELDNKPGIGMTSYNLAEHLSGMERCEEAQPLVEVAMSYYVDDPDTLRLAAAISWCLNNDQEARDFMEKAKTLAETWSEEDEQLRLKYQENL